MDKDYQYFVERMGSFDLDLDVEDIQHSDTPEKNEVNPKTIQHGETIVAQILNSKRR